MVDEGSAGESCADVLKSNKAEQKHPSLTVYGGDLTSNDLWFAMVTGVHRAAPAVNAMGVALGVFGTIVAPETMIPEEAAGGLSLGAAGATAGTEGAATVDDILQGAARQGASRSQQFAKSGGIEKAESDFKSLAGHEEISGGIKYKDLPNGQGRAVLRTDPSTWGGYPGPTLEIQPPGGGYAKIKIRY